MMFASFMIGVERLRVSDREGPAPLLALPVMVEVLL